MKAKEFIEQSRFKSPYIEQEVISLMTEYAQSQLEKERKNHKDVIFAIKHKISELTQNQRR